MKVPESSEAAPQAPPAPDAPPQPAQPPVLERSLWARMRHVSAYFRGKPLAWAGAVLATVVTASTEPVMPWFLKVVLDKGFTEGTLQLWLVPLMLIGLFVIRGAAQFASQYALARIANDGMVKLRRDMFGHLLGAEMALFSHQSASTLSNTLVYEAQTGSQLMSQGLWTVSRDGLSIIGLLGFLLYMNWQLTLVAFIVIPGVGWIMKVFTRRVYRFTKASQTATDELAYVVEENVLAHRMVRLYGAQQQQDGRFNRLSRALERLAIKSTIASALTTPLTQLFSVTAVSGIICIALWQNTRSSGQYITVGDFTAYMTALMMVIAPMRRMAEVSSLLTRGVAALERGLSLVEDIPPEHDGNQPAPDAITASQRGIEFCGVSVLYHEDQPPALEHLDLHIRPGEIVALVGASGSGKTTIANLLPRFVLPTGGQVLLDGLDIRQWRLRELRARFAMVSQDVVMFNDTIAANVALGQAQDETRIRQCLEAANLGSYLARQPQGIHTMVGHNASQLSGGQRQRLAIARALYKDAPILILDEATSALDTASERLVQEALQRLVQGRTTLIIAHRLSTIEHAHRVIVLDHGHIVEQGTHAELMQRDGFYARLQNLGGALP